MALTKITTNIIADNAITLDKIDTSSVAVTNWDTAYNWGDHSVEGYATETYVDTAVSNLVDSSPETLNTLNELAAALGDDANFAATTLNAIDLKAPLESPTFTGTIKSDNNILAEVAQTKVETATSVFVYDTRKDSDGGAWRKRTQHTSWYNETLNTATRGSRREFPAVAILVHTGSTIKIYDGDDPSMPLWGHYSNLTQDSGFAASVTARDGSIFGSQRNIQEPYSGNGWYQLNFAADYFFSNIIGIYGDFKQGRHDNLLTTNTYTLLGDRTTPLYSGNWAVNDLAVTVLPNAPIDTTTGLPIPTIAIATADGVSVIKDDGTVFNPVQYSGKHTRSLDLRENGDLFCDGALGTTWTDSYTPYTDGTWPISYPFSSAGNYPTTRKFSTPDSSYILKTPYGFAGEGAINGVLLYQTMLDPLDVRNGSAIAYTTSTYNTGWMNGDIKLATLSDTDDTDLVGSELVTNGTFDSSTGWTLSQGATISSGVLNLPADGTSGTAKYDTQILEAGKTYVLEYDITASTANYGVRWFYTNSGNTGTYFFTNYTKALGTHTATFTPDFDCWIGVSRVSVHTGSVSVDNVSVRLAEADRSVNGNGLQVFGTVQKNPVATGADLVAYSGFTTSNYLEQPYNSDLDFDTGDFCVMGWFKFETATTGLQRLWQRGASPTSGSFSGGGQIQIRLNADGKLGAYISDDNYVSYDIIPTLQRVDDNVWHLVTLVRAGKRLLLYIDGKISGQSNLVYAAGSLSNTEATTMIGLGQDFALPNTGGKQALWRASATAPTAKQIKKMYNDEKVLFQENAKATLYGTSDAVTALAYDEDTNLLHAGTSEGRSVFQGLRRVDNTTDAVTTAISASNGLVVEE